MSASSMKEAMQRLQGMCECWEHAHYPAARALLCAGERALGVLQDVYERLEEVERCPDPEAAASIGLRRILLRRKLEALEGAILQAHLPPAEEQAIRQHLGDVFTLA